MDIQVREAGENQINDVLILSKCFWSESKLSDKGLTFCEESAIQTIKHNTITDDTVGLCAYVDGVLAGYLFVYYQSYYTKERVGELGQFYIAPEYRKTEVARKLIENAIEQYKQWGCIRANCEFALDIYSEKSLKMLTNLWRKFGYKIVGSMLMKEFQHE